MVQLYTHNIFWYDNSLLHIEYTFENKCLVKFNLWWIYHSHLKAIYLICSIQSTQHNLFYSLLDTTTTTIDQLLYINKNAFCYNLLPILYINDAMNQNGHHDCMRSVCLSTLKSLCYYKASEWFLEYVIQHTYI